MQRGAGVLEAAGAASIKFRDRDVIATAHRIDPVLLDLDARLDAAKSDAAETANLQKQIKQREKMLFGVFQQVRDFSILNACAWLQTLHLFVFIANISSFFSFFVVFSFP